MAQGLSWWRQLIRESDNLLLLTLKSRGFKPRYPYRFNKSGSWLVGLFVVAMLFWNWQLLLATVAGVLVMVVVYFLQDWDWQLYLSSLRRFLSGTNRKLAIAVTSGGIATLSAYIMVSIWVEPNGSWIAAAAMFQGFGTLATLGLLVWQILKQQNSRDQIKHDELFIQLTDNDPLKRLLAVRHLTRWGTRHLEPSTQRQVTECFRLMLSRESEAIIRDAILDGLEVLGDAKGGLSRSVSLVQPLVDKRSGSQILAQGSQPLQIPVVIKQAEGVGSGE